MRHSHPFASLPSLALRCAALAACAAIVGCASYSRAHGPHEEREWGGDSGTRATVAGHDEEPPMMDGMVADDASYRPEETKTEAQPVTAEDAGPGASGGEDGAASGEAAAATRRYFPETMFVNPQMITDADGRAVITIDQMPDSITTWLVRAQAHTADGVFGEGAGTFRVFQDVFLNLQLPHTLTVGDSVTVPLTVMNYSQLPIDVSVSIQRASWLEILDADRLRMQVDPGMANKQYATIRVVEPGTHELVVRALAGQARDTVALPVRVVPNGIARRTVRTLRIASSQSLQLIFPSVAPPDYNEDAAAAVDADAVRRVIVTATPSSLSQLLAAQRALLQRPTGCLEQTLSQTLVDVEVARGLAAIDTPQANAALDGARRILGFAYQRIVGYLDPNSGRFGSYPGHFDYNGDQWLNAYALWVLKALGEFTPVDAELIARLEAAFVADLTAGGAREMQLFGLWGYVRNRPTSTGNAAAALPMQVANLLDRLRTAPLAHFSAFELALMLNVFASLKDNRFNAAMDELLGRFEFGSGDAFGLPTLRNGAAQIRAITPARGPAAAAEVAALLLIGMAEYGYTEPIRDQMVDLMLAERDPDGLWPTTFSTALILRALAVIDQQRQTEGATARTLSGSFNGAPFEPLSIAVGKGAQMQQIEFDAEMANSLELVPVGEVLVQIVQETYFPDARNFPLEAQAFDLRVTPDKDTMRQGETAKLKVALKRRAYAPPANFAFDAWWPGEGFVPPMAPGAQPVMVVVGIPGTFRVFEDSLEVLKNSGRIQRYEIDGREVRLYLNYLPPDGFSAELTVFANYVGTATAPPASAYEYYNPTGYGYAAPLTFTVAK